MKIKISDLATMKCQGTMCLCNCLSTQAVDLAGEGNGELIKDSINRLQKTSLATSQYIEATRKLVTHLNSSKSMCLSIFVRLCF